MRMPKPSISASNRRCRIDAQGSADRQRAGQRANEHHGDKAAQGIARFEQNKLGKNGAHTVAAVLPTRSR